MNIIMVIRVECHIDRNYFMKHKKEIQKLLLKPAFEIAVMKFEKQLSCREIAKKQGLSTRNIRKILSGVCEKTKKYKSLIFNI